MTTPCLDAALRYATRGWRVIPVAHDKTPLTKNGSKDASCEEEVIRAWWDKFPSAGVAIATGQASGLWVFDVDPKNGGEASLSSLVATHGPIGVGPTVLTGGGGQHFYFAHDPRVRQSSIADGLDVRSEGGYVVAPPTLHDSGRQYAFYEYFDPDEDLPAGPEWLLGLVQTRAVPVTSRVAGSVATPSSATNAYGRKALSALFEELRGVPPGARDIKRNAIAYRVGRLVAGGSVAHHDAISMLMTACAENGLVEDLGTEEVCLRITRAVEAGIQSGPVGPAPKPQTRVILDDAGVGEEVDPDEQNTDVGNGRRLVRLFGEDLRWCKAFGWLVFDGEVWRPDDCGRVFALAKESVRRMRVEASSEEEGSEALYKHALRSESAGAIHAAVEMAQSEDGITIPHDRLDAEPMSLCAANGVIDLSTGAVRTSRREDYISRAIYARYDPTASCPRWMRFLDEVFCSNQEVIQFVQKAVGYTLTGSTREQVLFLCHGVGSNGKSTLLSTLNLLLGSYAAHADFTTFLVSNRVGGGPRGDLARLAGCRFVSSTEPDGSSRFSESTIKAITGGDPVTCAFKYRDEFTYTPQFKLWLAANHKPRIIGTDHAIWRRIRLIPFSRVFDKSEVDKNLPIALSQESSGILRWAVEGCMLWQKEGLDPPEAVSAATQAYREEEDSMAEFIEERCTVLPGATCYAADLYTAYKEWAESQGEDVISKQALGRRLSERGYEKFKEDGTSARCWRGISKRLR